MSLKKVLSAINELLVMGLYYGLRAKYHLYNLPAPKTDESNIAGIFAVIIAAIIAMGALAIA